MTVMAIGYLILLGIDFFILHESIAELCYYYNSIEHTINAAYAEHMKRKLGVMLSSIQQLSCILIGCIFYGKEKLQL